MWIVGDDRRCDLSKPVVRADVAIKKVELSPDLPTLTKRDLFYFSNPGSFLF